MPNRLSIGFAVLAGLVAWSTAAAANDGGRLARPTLAGSYLAARSADAAKDIDAAATFYSDALADDPGNPTLLERTVILHAADGNLDQAFDPAERLAEGRQRQPDRAPGSGDPCHLGAAIRDRARRPGQRRQGAAGDADHRADRRLGRLRPRQGRRRRSRRSTRSTDRAGTASSRTTTRADPRCRRAHGEAAVAITSAYNTDGSALRVVEAYARILARAGIARRRPQGADRIRQDFGAAPGGQGTRGRHPRRQADRAGGRDGARRARPRCSTGWARPSAATADRSCRSPICSLRAISTRRSIWPTWRSATCCRRRQRCDEAIVVYERVPEALALRRNADLQIAACLAGPRQAGQGGPLCRSACSMPIRTTSRRRSCSATSTG